MFAHTDIFGSLLAAFKLFQGRNIWVFYDLVGHFDTEGVAVADK